MYLMKNSNTESLISLIMLSSCRTLFMLNSLKTVCDTPISISNNLHTFQTTVDSVLSQTAYSNSMRESETQIHVSQSLNVSPSNFSLLLLIVIDWISFKYIYCSVHVLRFSEGVAPYSFFKSQKCALLFFRSLKCILPFFRDEKKALPFFHHQQGEKAAFLPKIVKYYLKSMRPRKFLLSKTADFAPKRHFVSTWRNI